MGWGSLLPTGIRFQFCSLVKSFPQEVKAFLGKRDLQGKWGQFMKAYTFLPPPQATWGALSDNSPGESDEVLSRRAWKNVGPPMTVARRNFWVTS